MPFRRALAALLVALVPAAAAAQQALPPDEAPEFPSQPGPDIDADETGPATGEHHPDDAPLTREERLDRLFAALGDPENGEHAVLQRRIAQLWSESGSDSMDLLLSRGREALEGEEYEKALDHFTALVDLDPDFAEGWNARATAWYLKDEYWRAVSDIRKALELEPRHFGALSGLGVILERIGDADGALRAYRAATELNPHLETAQKAVERLSPKVDGRDI